MTAPDPAELLPRLVAIPSESGAEGELAAFVLDWARGHRLDAAMVGRNLVIRAGRPSGRRLLLCSHLDTVAPVAGWPHDPFEPREQDGRISGLGANDAKGCVAAMLCAMAGLGGAPPACEVVLALVVDEEVGGGEGLATILPQLGRLDAAVIGEPTGLDLCISQKGLLILELETAGVARHAAHAHRLPGANAVVEAAHAIARLAGFEPAPPHPLLGPVTCHVTTIEGGTRRNVIPDRCRFMLDIRTVTPGASAAIVAAVAERSGAAVRVFSDRMQPFDTDPAATVVAAARRARPQASLVGSATMSDGVWTRHLPTVKAGPGASERSHTAGEWVSRNELREGATFYRRLIDEYATLTTAGHDGRSAV